MDKESKKILKEAREAIKQKNYSVALNCCQGILKTDVDNYLALVLSGAALQELGGRKELAIDAFEKAILVSPEQILAWQGLVSFYEKHDPKNKKLLKIYSELLGLLESDLDKFIEISNKQSHLAVHHQDIPCAVTCLKLLLIKLKLDAEKCNDVWRRLVTILLTQTEISDNDHLLLEETLENIISNFKTTSQSTDDITYYQHYLKVLYKLRKLDQLIIKSKEMHSIFTSSPSPLEWLCRIVIEDEGDNEEITEEYADKLLELQPLSYLGLVSKGLYRYHDNQITIARDYLKKGLQQWSSCVTGWKYLTLCCLRCHDYYTAENSALEALKLLANKKNIAKTNSLLLYQCQALCGQNSHPVSMQGLELCKKIQTYEPLHNEATFLIGKLYYNLQQHTELTDAIQQLISYVGENSQTAFLQCLATTLEKETVDSLIVVQEYVKEYPNSADICLHVAMLQWKVNDISNSVQSFLGMLGLLHEAVNQLEKLLDQKVDYVPALKVLGETYISLATNMLKENRDARALALCQQAIQVLTQAAHLRPDFCSLWKLLGDACAIPHVLMKDTKISVPLLLVSKEQNVNEDDMVEIDMQQLLQLGGRCYYRCIQLATKIPNNTIDHYLWHDVAVNLCYQATYLPDDLESQRILLDKAILSMKNAIMLSPTDHKHWNMLGVLAAHKSIKNYALSQHCFICSLELEPQSVEAWTHLGTLYLIAEDLQLAHQAFTKAQCIEPAYCEPWIGQALIAESLQPHDSIDLFRHTTQLMYHPQGALGYGQWVCNIINQDSKETKLFDYHIHKMSAIPMASQALTWYTGRICDDICALNLLGLLLERQSLYQGACKAFVKALTLKCTPEQLDMIRSNYGRVLTSSCRYEEAINVFNSISEADFYSHCGLALACWKADKFEDSYSSYESALHWLAPDDNQKSNVLVAMAAMAYKCKGPTEAKTLLFQSSQLQPPSVPGLFALCALGLLHSDVGLIKAAFQELQKHKDDPIHRSHYLFMNSTILQVENKHDEAVTLLQQQVHMYPDSSSAWYQLASLLYILNKPASACAYAAGKEPLAKVVLILSLLIEGKTDLALIHAQDAVHSYPWENNYWFCLIACIHSQSDRSIQQLQWLKDMISVHRRRTCSRKISQWLSGYERKIVNELQQHIY